ncbi:MAG: multifunctional oxoglutarate decarboxylase/oxoglutarate dehydrogenase thiamine pyrophosphate-binding subunit/dihydrolipoyllysine-residue succinyltransferase subunit [Candidatus Eremiobacteraeota bacterium]|nr:multifunctional oxoglutarate decarboxylase/oxoglutarate dehydrogenase thiamine pyrophosphate-binding subunit/dihydrolipoyllysine-residue succinyltransferase subunit [Candidatus Eremiobacteraeota bacterium]
MIGATVQVPLPEMGESVTEGSIVEWRKRVGDWVDAGETLVEVTTDKVDVEVPAPVAGVVTKVLAPEGATLAVGTPLAEIDTTAERPAGVVPPKAPAPAAERAAGNGAPAPPAAPPSGLATPQALRSAERRGVDIKSVRGTGPDGLVLRHDVDLAIENGSAKLAAPGAGPQLPAPPVPRDATITPLRGPVGTLASYMEQSLTIPTATSFRTIGVGMLDVRRKQLNDALAASGKSQKISFTHLIAFALVRATRDVPGMTASFRREDGAPQRIDAPANLGLAVDVERKDGTRFLMVPVIKNAGALDFAAFRARYEELVGKARENKLSADDLSGATFTLTNPGGIGTVASVPRLMAGQGTIVATGAIGYPSGFAKAPAQTLQLLGIEKVMTMTSTYDHRVIQGAQSGEYLRRVEQLLNDASFYADVFGSFGLSAPTTTFAALATTTSTVGTAQSEELLRGASAGQALVANYRIHGHMAANLDPLGSEPPGDPGLDPRTYNLTPAIMSAIPATVLHTKVGGSSLAEIVPRLRDTYAGQIAYQFEHISHREQRRWLRDYVESGLNRVKLSAERKVQILGRLTKVEAMERYMRKTSLAQKTFSIEGLDVMVPMLEEMISMLADDGTKAVVIGMAHRGRLATIAHVVNRPYEELLGEFEAAKLRGEQDEGNDALGDVKYHHGAEGVYTTPNGTKIQVLLESNPSHLEAVDGVVEGATRALQTDHKVNPPTLDATKAAPILIHGDASFPGQGVVAEVLNLQALAGYETGGTIHIIANNQLGFTTDPDQDRSTRYASDLAKGYDVPIVHVNADDVEACMSAVHFALDFKTKFGRDVLIDLIGYRRFGHNEQDEPAYTQPAMYERIKTHPTVRELFAAHLVAEGVLAADQAQGLVDAAYARLAEQHEIAKQRASVLISKPATDYAADESVETHAPKEQLLAWSRELIRVPEGFTINPKLQRQFEKRQEQLEATGEVDWGLAEWLAFASLLSEGTPVRLTGQDTERGTFSHRHAVLHDAQSGATYVPLQRLSSAKASFEIYNSPLSEYACMGFEYGYSVASPDAMVLWEAQFGDFVNGAQIIVDQFLAAGLAKWDQASRLTLLLPHGYEGMGPEHSSGRIERFLQLSAEGNVRVADPSTAAQYFHLLRLQALEKHGFPMVIFTPKSLLRHTSAFGTLDELATGAFRQVIDDPKMSSNRKAVERIILCTGKIYHDLINDPNYANMKKTAIVRIELLSPLPRKQVLSILDSYPNAKKVVWVQEEPQNMGARAHVRRRLVERLPKRFADIDYIGRPYRASPSEGYPGAHAVEQERIIKLALSE